MNIIPRKHFSTNREEPQNPALGSTSAIASDFAKLKGLDRPNPRTADRLVIRSSLWRLEEWDALPAEGVTRSKLNEHHPAHCSTGQINRSIWELILHDQVGGTGLDVGSFDELEKTYRRGDPMRMLVSEFELSAEQICIRLIASESTDNDLIRTRAVRDRTHRTHLELQTHETMVRRLVDSGVSIEDVPKVLGAVTGSIIDKDMAVELLHTRGTPDSPILADRNAPKLPLLSDKLSLLYITGRHHEKATDYELGLGKMSLSAVKELRGLLYEGLPYRRMAEILAVIETTAQAIRADRELTLSILEYETAARKFSRQNGKVSIDPEESWPAPADLLRVRLGNGFWEDALRAVGLASPRIDQIYSENECFQALEEFTVTCPGGDLLAYDRWVIGEIASCGERPSAVAILRHYDSWNDAIESIIPSDDDQDYDAEPDDHEFYWGFSFGMEDVTLAANEEKSRRTSE
ncbi:hypothetical protein [Arthrobacter monumenti]